MNVFSGSRRIAFVIGILWIFGWAIAAALHETTVQARYDFVVGRKFANFAGFDIYSCPHPQLTDERSLEIKTAAGRPVRVTLCILGSSINVPAGFVLEPFDPDVYLAKKQLELRSGLGPNTIKVFFADGTSHVYANASVETNSIEEITTDKVLQRAKQDFPSKKVAIIVGNGAHWVDYEDLARIFGGKVHVDENKKIALANALTRLQQEINPEDKALHNNPFDIFDERTIHSAFKISKEEESRLNEKWWESWRSAYGQGLAIMLSGLGALWIFSLSLGWIVRGFLGVPRGMDSKP